VVGNSADRLALCGTTVRGRLTLNNVVGPVLIGDAVNGRCAGNFIQGQASITGTQKGLKAGDNLFGMDFTLTSNLKGTAVEANQVNGRLNCTNNSPKPTNNGRPNHAGARFGQCVNL
jgi:hypothetical protein